MKSSFIYEVFILYEVFIPARTSLSLSEVFVWGLCLYSKSLSLYKGVVFLFFVFYLCMKSLYLQEHRCLCKVCISIHSLHHCMKSFASLRLSLFLYRCISSSLNNNNYEKKKTNVFFHMPFLHRST